LIEYYSARQLTYSSEKLPVISAIAKQEANGKTYLAGIWKEDLWFHLAWLVPAYAGNLLRLRPAPYRAPSWSWAAVDSKVDFRYRATAQKGGGVHPIGNNMMPLIKCTDATVTLVSSKMPFGPVNEGSLVVVDPVATVHWLRRDVGDDEILSDDGQYFCVYLDTLEPILPYDDSEASPLLALALLNYSQLGGLILQLVS
jgi:hypothetical protein